MRNRAKCKLCGDILESFHRHDYVTCSCGEISVDGGNDYYRASARDWKNFLRVDDMNNEIIVKVKDENESEETTTIDGPSKKLSKHELMEMLSASIKAIEDLPSQAMTLPITHYDHLALMMLLKAILEAKE